MKLTNPFKRKTKAERIEEVKKLYHDTFCALDDISYQGFLNLKTAELRKIRGIENEPESKPIFYFNTQI